MARKPTGKPNGAPKKEVDWIMFEQLCAIQCTQSEMASFLKVHADTLSDKVREHYGDGFTEVYKKFSESGKCSLRRNQFVLSKTNTAMAIWLGKQWLGQRDLAEIEINTEIAKGVTNVLEYFQAKQNKQKQIEVPNGQSAQIDTQTEPHSQD